MITNSPTANAKDALTLPVLVFIVRNRIEKVIHRPLNAINTVLSVEAERPSSLSVFERGVLPNAKDEPRQRRSLALAPCWAAWIQEVSATSVADGISAIEFGGKISTCSERRHAHLADKPSKLQPSILGAH
jgi:hypothetical protein